jgi:hypothetical protein
VLAESPNYIAAVENTRVVGAHIGELIEFLVAQTGARLAEFHLIGHSLGAHTAGFAGQSITTGKVGRITGLYYSVEEASVGLDPCVFRVKHILPNRFLLTIHHHLLNVFDVK